MRRVCAFHGLTKASGRRRCPSSDRRAGQPATGGSGTGSVLIGNKAGARMAVQHLLQVGHRAVAFFAGPPASHSGREQFKGYRAALAAAGLLNNPDWTRHCSPVVEGGKKTTCELLIVHPELTALFCYNDLVTVDASQACADLGHRVSGDLAAVGLDDILPVALVAPFLTTCPAPRFELGAQAMRLP